jgi:hypothetical protein
MKKVILHRDGMVSYWSVYRQVRVARASYVSDEELAAMGARDRERVIRHLGL